MKRWSEKERNILRDYYYLLNASELALKLPKRSRSSIIKQVHYLRKRGWAFKGRTKK
jgi:hypothetical protein